MAKEIGISQYSILLSILLLASVSVVFYRLCVQNIPS